MTELLFVYNADGSVFAQLADAAHKALSPRTYNCGLCMLTYGNLRMKPSWKRLVQSLDATVTFQHRDEFAREHPSLATTTTLPAAFVRTDDTDDYAPFITADEFNAMKSLDDLEKLVVARLSGAVGS